MREGVHVKRTRTNKAVVTVKYWKFQANIFFFLFEFPVKRVIFVNKNGGVMSKIYCLISWFPISTPLILVSASLKMASVSVAVIYDSTESGHPWRTLHVSVKESGRRPFTLALDWVLVYPTLII